MNDSQVQIEIGTANQARTLFKPGSWLAKIDFINHLVLFNNVLIPVLAEKQGGKTSFSSLLLTNLDPQIKPISMIIKPPCNTSMIINDIAAQLHLNNDAHTTVATIVAQINERKAHVLLVIDDAQNLPESFIKEIMLEIKNQDNFGFFHICLVSDYSVVATLNNFASGQFSNLIHTIELGLLSEAETRTYVLQRAMIGRLINKPLTEAQFKQFFQLTRGNLAKINAHLELFILKCSSVGRSNTNLILKRTSMAISAVVVAGFSFVYFNGLYKAPLPDTVSITKVPTEKKVTIAALPIPSQPLESRIASWRDSSTIQLVEYTLPKMQILDEAANNEQIINTKAIVDKVLVIPTVSHVAIKTEPAPQTVPPVLESQLVQLPKNNPSTLATKPVATNIKIYTIQLVAGASVADVNRFKHSSKLFSNAAVKHYSGSKGSWYVLTYGEYASPNEAKQHANKLVAQMSTLKPWIRTLSGLKNVG